MNSDLRALPSPSTSSSSTTSGYSSGIYVPAPPKQLAWQRSGHGGAMQYGSGVFREPDRLENGEKIKRPMNAFMVWSQIRRAQIANQDGKMHNSQISKELGIEWRKMNAEQKAPYIQRAKDLRDELMRQHPDYVYRPKRKPRLRQKSPRALSAPAGHNIAPNNAIPTMSGGGPTVTQTGAQVQIQAQAQQAATTQMLLAAAAQQQQSLLLAAYQAQLAAVSSKTAEIGNDKISLASDRISDALLKSSQCAGSNGGLLAPPFGLLSYTGGMVQPTALTTASPLDTNRSFAAALASLNAHLNPLFLAQLSSSLMMANSLPNANSQ
ncbi:unnamed protein product [Toxocara canis]|uniref:Sex-determining region Y protein n=1 Tax=Toxocara canis TaxID=6265 RepID=A0A183UIG0_TOXCA|nr:unnamed protein product [Toxocara canis]